MRLLRAPPHQKRVDLPPYRARRKKGSAIYVRQKGVGVVIAGTARRCGGFTSGCKAHRGRKTMKQGNAGGAILSAFSLFTEKRGSFSRARFRARGCGAEAYKSLIINRLSSFLRAPAPQGVGRKSLRRYRAGLLPAREQGGVQALARKDARRRRDKPQKADNEKKPRRVKAGSILSDEREAREIGKCRPRRGEGLLSECGRSP